MPNRDAAQDGVKLVNYALLLVLATLWGASYTFLKIGVETIPPVTFIAARTLIAGSLLLAILNLRGIRMPRDIATWRKFAFQTLMNAMLPFTLIAWASQTMNASLAVILNSTSPIFTFLITWLITRHEPVTGVKAIGVVTGLAGISLIIGVGAWGHLGQDILAQLAVVAATIAYAIAAIYGRNFKGLDPMVPACGSLLAGAVLILPFSLIVDHPWTISPSAASLWALVLLSVFSTALAFVIYFHLLRTLGSVGTTSQAYLRVPIGVGIGMLVLGEQLSWVAGAGLVLVFVGVAAMTMQVKRKEATVVAASTRV